jgi:hypothetical protein
MNEVERIWAMVGRGIECKEEAFAEGYKAGQASMRPHLNQLAQQLGAAPVGDLTAQVEGITIGAVQAQIG